MIERNLMNLSLPVRLRSTAIAAGLILCACSSGGGSSSTPTPVSPVPSQPPVSVTLSGTLTYDRVPLNKSTNGLNFDATFQEPIRAATVELLNSAGTILDETTSGSDGTYSFTLDSGQSVRVRVKSEIERAGASEIDLRIVDNTSSNALYALDGSLSAMPRSDQTRDLNAGSGWGTTSYTGTRAAAPFAIMDTMFEVMEQFRGVDTEVDFPPLRVFWSENNRPVAGNISDGEVSTSFYSIIDGLPTVVILGAENTDTDEFDLHVVTHEFGHYFENRLSRADSIGGPHSGADRLDPRVAFGEGFGNALAAIINTDDPTYRDSFGSQQTRGFEINAEADTFTESGAAVFREFIGWYSELTVYQLLFDLFDENNESSDLVTFGLEPFYRTFVDSDYSETAAFTTIFSYLDAYKTQAGVDADAVTELARRRGINGTGIFGLGETNDDDFEDALPVYLEVAVDGTPSLVCTTDQFGTFNKLGNRRFLRFEITTAGTYDFDMSVVSADNTTDPDFTVFRNGNPILNGFSGVTDRERASATLQTGIYVVEAYDDRGSSGGVCHNFTIQ